MKNTKRRIEPLSFFDHTGISAHLEKMAAKGWMIEKFDPEFGAQNDYLLCYDDLLVEISFDWEPTAEQMAIVGEKLNGN